MAFIDQLRPVLGALEDDAISSALSDIPVIAEDLTSLISSLNLDDLEDAIDAALAGINAALGPAARASAIANELNNLDGITAVAAGTVVTTTLTTQTDATVELLNEDIGLGGSAFSLDAQADFTGSIAVDLDLNLTYDTSTDTLAFVDTAGDELTLSTDISANVSAAATIANGFIAAELTDTLATPEIALTAGFNMASLSPADLSVTYGGSARLQLDFATIVADGLLPGVTAALEIAWDPLDPTRAPTIMFSDVGMTIGELLDAITDMLDPITDILFEGIIGDIVGILTDPLPIINDGLNAVGLIDLFDTIPTSGDGIFNLLDGIGIYLEQTGNTQGVEVLSAFAEALAILKQLSDFADNDDIIPLGNIMIPGFDPDVESPELPDFQVADIGGLTPIEFLSDLANTTDLFAQVLDSVPGLSDAGLSSLTTATVEDESGLSFPLFENPELILDVLLPELTGADPVSLFEYNIPAITAEARFGEYFFSIFGPFGLTIDGFAESTIDFTIGYDTYALQNPDSSFADGLFITTDEMMPGEQIERQPDDLQFEYRPIAYSSAGIFAGVAVDAVVLRVGVKGGIVGFVAAFLPGGEVDTDAGEVPNGVLRLSDFGSGCFLDPILGRIGAEVIASIKVGFGIFSFEYDVTIADITLANFEFGCPPAIEEIDGLARFVGPNVLLHVGPEAGNRVIGGQVGADDAETYRISAAVDEEGVLVPGALRVEYAGFFQNFGVEDGEPNPNQINANFGNEDDALVISSDLAIRVIASGGAGNDILEGASLNDILLGNEDNDRLFGRAGDDVLEGGSGSDYLEGGLGADTLNGGADRDRVSYEASAVGVSLAWNGFQIIGSGGEAEGDILNSIEYIVGSAHDDVLTANPFEDSTLQGNAGDDALIGGAGGDFILGDGGADLLFGGAGHDGTSYVTSSGAVRIDLETGTGDGGDATGDVLVSIESAMGSAFADVLEGTSGFNQLAGWVGDDIIDGRGGADEITTDIGDDTVYARGDGAAFIDGGEGRDLLSYARAGTAVNVDLGAGTGEGSDIDVISHVQVEQPDGTFLPSARSTFEDLDGTNFNDTLTGDLQANTIQGFAGNDSLNGGDGNDLLRGGSGEDTLNGGDGNDWADYTDGFGVSVALSGGAGFGSTAQGDIIINVENLRGSNGADALIGDDDDNILAPMLSSGSTDIVDGLNGDDTLQIDYSLQDWGRGIQGGLTAGAFSRLSFDGLTLLDGVGFQNIENFHIVGTIRDDIIDTGDGDDRLYLGGGNDIANSGSGADIVLTQEGNDSVTYFSDEEMPLFFLNGGRGTDGLTLRLAETTQDLTVRAGLNVPFNVIVDSGGSAVNFENLDVILTGRGSDLIEQGGISTNNLNGGGGADIINPGRGIDTVNGGSDIVTDAPVFNVSDSPVYILTDTVQLLELATAPGDKLVLDWSDVGSAISSSVDRFLTARAAYESSQNATTFLQFFNQSGVYETADGIDRTDFFRIEAVDITGGAFDDTIIGTWAGLELFIAAGDTTTPPFVLGTPRGNDILRGEDGNDTLTGLTGSDTLIGGEGDDLLTGTDTSINPANIDEIPFDTTEIDILTGGAGADRFVLGTLRGTFPFLTEQVLYTGRVNADNDGTDSRAIITDFDASQGDRLILAGGADDYVLEAADDGINILLADGPRNIIAHLEGVEELTLDASTTIFRTGFSFTLEPPTPTPPIFPIFTPTFTSDQGVTLELDPGLTLSPNFSPIGSDLADALALQPSVQIAAPIDILPEPTIAPTTLELAEATDPTGNDEDRWVFQSNLPSVLEDYLFEGTNGEITNGTLTLEGDARAFGIFDGDPFGLGQGIVLSTGAVDDLDEPNEIDGGLFGPYTPDLVFENLGNFGDSAIFRADLSFLATELNSITIADDGDALGGGTGAVSGLDLDALVLSRQLVTDTDITNGLDFNDPTQFARLDVFNYASAFSQFTPGSIRSNSGPSPVDLRGTQNGIINLNQATLTDFDYDKVAGDGFVTLGDGGTVGFDLTETVDTDGPLYLYVAEAGANEELEATITASDARLAAPADLSTDFGAEGSDGDLTRLTYTFNMDADAGKLVSFDFAFVTEELREFAGTEFNDALRIYLNGEQLAELSDGTALTTNQLLPAPFAASHPDLLFNNVEDGLIREHTRVDAYTTPLSFVGRTVGRTNTLVIEIEDVRDGLMDSAVLIKAGSFDVMDDSGVVSLPPSGEDKTSPRPEIELSSRFISLLEGEDAVEIDITITGIAALTSEVVLIFNPFSEDIDLGSGAGIEHKVVFDAGGPLTQTLKISAPDDGIDEPTEFVLATVDVQSAGVLNGHPVAPLVVEVLAKEDGSVFGTPEDEVLEGDTSPNTIIGLSGVDQIEGLGGNDTIFGGADEDIMSGGSGDDEFRGTPSDFMGDRITDLEIGDAIILDHIGFDAPAIAASIATQQTILSLNNVQFFLDGDFTEQSFLISSYEGETTLELSDATVTELTPAGERFITIDEGPNNVFGDNGNDVIGTASGADILIGGGGFDVMLAGAGDDILIGGAGGDSKTGGAGADIFSFDISDFAGAGFVADFITDFEIGVDQIELSGFGILSLNDLNFQSLATGDAIDLGNGAFIVLEGINSEDLVAQDIVGLDHGRALSLLSNTNLHVLTDANDRFVTTDPGNNEVRAGAGLDAVIGGDGADILFGENDGDVLIGGGGNDRLIGGQGSDQLTGRDGADIFEFEAGEETGFAADFITDFETDDTLSLDGFGFNSADDLTFFNVGATGDLAILLSPTHSIILEGIIDADQLTDAFVFS